MSQNITVIEGEANVRNARILTLRAALKLEIKGLRGRFNAYKIIKAELGFKGSRASVLEQLNAYIEENILSKAEPPKRESPAEIASRVHPFNDHQRTALEQSLADA